MFRKIIYAVSLLILSCSYSVYSSAYPHLKTINILQFENKTTEYSLSEEVYVSLSNDFNNDGRLRLVEISPDCQLTGEILDYSDKIYGYTKSDIEEYEVKILMKISMLDLTNNEIIWKNDNLLLREVYSIDDINSEFATEEEARNEIFKNLFDLIVKNSLEKW